MAQFTVYVDSNATTPGSGTFSDPFTSLASGIAGVLASGLTDLDVGIVSVLSGTYLETSTFTHASGLLMISSQDGTFTTKLDSTGSGLLLIDSLDVEEFDASGSASLVYQNAQLGTSGTADSNFIDNIVVRLDNITIDQTIDIDGGESVTIVRPFASGTDVLIDISGVTDQVEILSGVITHGSGMLSLDDCSGILLSRLNGCAFISGVPLSISNSSGFLIDHVTFVNFSSGVLDLTTSSGNMEWSILAASGNFPVSLTSSLLFASGTNLVNYASIGTDNPGVSGTPSAIDPLITDIDACDLRLRATSPLASAADPIPDLIDANLLETEFTPTSVKFFDQDNQGIKATDPSGLYVVQGGKAIFIPSQSGGIESNIDITVNARYIVEGNVSGVQSYTSVEGLVGEGNLYPLDYKVLPSLNESKNIDDFTLEPYTIVPLGGLIAGALTSDLKLENITASSLFEFSGLTYDSSIHELDNLKAYWVLEKNNNYLYKYSSDKDTLIRTYMLFAPDPNASGINKTVRPTDFESLSSNPGSAKVITRKYIDREEVSFSQKIIDLADSTQEIEWEPADIDPNKKALALNNVEDHLFILTEVIVETSGDPEVSLDMYIYNKIDKDFPRTPTRVISGVMSPQDGRPTDMTLDDVGNFYVSVSGQIQKIIPRFDYAFKSNTDGAIRTTVVFRERYDEVNL